MTTCFSKKFGIYHNDIPLDGDEIIQDKPFDEPGDYIDGQWVKLPAIVPKSVTNLQGKRALIQFGIYDQIVALVAQADIVTQLAWASGSFERDSEFVATLAAQVPLTDNQIDQLFILAATFV